MEEKKSDDKIQYELQVADEMLNLIDKYSACTTCVDSDFYVKTLNNIVHNLFKTNFMNYLESLGFVLNNKKLNIEKYILTDDISTILYKKYKEENNTKSLLFNCYFFAKTRILKGIAYNDNLYLRKYCERIELYPYQYLGKNIGVNETGQWLNKPDIDFEKTVNYAYIFFISNDIFKDSVEQSIYENTLSDEFYNTLYNEFIQKVIEEFKPNYAGYIGLSKYEENLKIQNKDYRLYQFNWFVNNPDAAKFYNGLESLLKHYRTKLFRALTPQLIAKKEKELEQLKNFITK